jgi:hypothetical protein
MTATLAYLYRRARGERWAGTHGSARFACSLRQLVVGLAPVMGWSGTPEQLLRAHRASVQRWLDWLQDAGLVQHTPQQDEEGWWWRTIITIQALPELEAELLAVVAERMKGWTRREARRRARGRRSAHGRRLRDLTLLLRRSRLTRAERRRRAHVRRRALLEYAERLRVRALLQSELIDKKTHLRHPFGASATPRTTLESNHSSESSARTESGAHTWVTTPIARVRQAKTTGTEDGRAQARLSAARSVVARRACVDPRDPDAVAWKIAREVAGVWRSRPEAAWAPQLDAVERRVAELQRWPAAVPAPRWRLLEAWTAVVWGPLYAASGGAQRLPLWSEQRDPSTLIDQPEWLRRLPHPNTVRLQSAIARYERHSAYRPRGWPVSGLAALLAWVRFAHRGENAPPRCLAYDLAGFAKLTKQLAAYAKLQQHPDVLARKPRAPKQRSSAFSFRSQPAGRRWSSPSSPQSTPSRQLAADAYARRLPYLEAYEQR